MEFKFIQKNMTCPNCSSIDFTEKPIEEHKAKGLRKIEWGILCFFVMFTLPLISGMINGRYSFEEVDVWYRMIFSMLILIILGSLHFIQICVESKERRQRICNICGQIICEI